MKFADVGPFYLFTVLMEFYEVEKIQVLTKCSLAIVLVLCVLLVPYLRGFGEPDYEELLLFSTCCTDSVLNKSIFHF